MVLDNGEQIKLGHIPLHMGRNEAADDDLDDDGVLDHPLILDDVGAGNPLSQSDVDDDDINDWDDQDHGGYHYGSGTVAPQDHDADGIPNVYDNDHKQRSGDRDGDGLPDHIDANPDNDPDHNNDTLDNDCDDDGEGLNCGAGPGTTPPSPEQPPSPVQPPNGLDGQVLYIKNCTGSGCHSSSGMRGRTFTQITNAINSNHGGMGSISLMTEEIQAIANYLAQ